MSGTSYHNQIDCIDTFLIKVPLRISVLRVIITGNFIETGCLACRCFPLVAMGCQWLPLLSIRCHCFLFTAISLFTVGISVLSPKNGNQWKAVVTTGNPRQPMESNGNLWQPLANKASNFDEVPAMRVYDCVESTRMRRLLGLLEYPVVQYHRVCRAGIIHNNASSLFENRRIRHCAPLTLVQPYSTLASSRVALYYYL